MGPVNAIVGDDFGTSIPETRTPENASDEIQKTARFSKTKEFKELKAYFESRITWYQTYLPDGRPAVSEADAVKQGVNWSIANAIIGEFKAVIDVYEQAAKIVEDERSAAR